METNPQVRAVHALSRFVVSKTTLQDTLEEICRITTEALPAAVFAGMTLVDEQGRAATSVFTDDESPAIDAAQYESGEGPCLEAWRTGEVVRVDDTADAEAPYAAFRDLARSHGICSTLSIPLHVGDDALGALNLYSRAVEGFSTEEEELAVELAAVGSVVLANSADYWAAQDLARQLDEAMQSRATIEQAKGILMATDPAVDPDGAFDLLRKASQRENIKIRDLADRIVANRDHLPAT